MAAEDLCNLFECGGGLLSQRIAVKREIDAVDIYLLPVSKRPFEIAAITRAPCYRERWVFDLHNA